MYSWKVLRRKLSKQDKENGIIFKSQLNHDGQIGTLHEAKDFETMKRLKDVRFFKNMARDFDFHVTEIRWY